MNEKQTIMNVLMKLLHAIRDGDVKIYREIVSEELTCFEPETKGHNVKGLDFHLFFMQNAKVEHPYHIELVDPVINVYGDTAYAAYTLIQNTYDHGEYRIKSVNETRIFNKQMGIWKLVHFHRG